VCRRPIGVVVGPTFWEARGWGLAGTPPGIKQGNAAMPVLVGSVLRRVP
jgi:hypothetical protein